MRKFLPLLVLPFALACASGSHYSNTKSEKVNPDFKGGPGKKLLVVVATQDPGMREDVETQFTIQGVERGMKITPSHRLVADFRSVDRAALEGLVKTGGYDRVLLVRSVRGTAGTGKTTEMRDYYTIHGDLSGIYDMYDTWGSTVTVVFSPTDPPPTMGRYLSLDIESLLYNSEDAKLIWNSTARVTTSRNQGEAAGNFVKEVLQQLNRAGLIASK